MKKVSEMTAKELKQELNSVNEHIEFCSSGRREMYYRDELEREILKRGIKLRTIIV